MVIIQLNGGLGNQLFQYAAARSLALHNYTEVKLDVTEFGKQDLRNLELFNFNVDASVATNEEIKLLKAETTFQRITSQLISTAHKKFYKQTFFHFDEKFFLLKPPVYLCGFFQSQLFFKPIEQQIRKEFYLKDELVKRVKEFGEKLQQENSVAIHIRRGDYNNKTSLEYHGILSEEYYKTAFRMMKEQLKGPVFYIFSDNPETTSKIISHDAGEVISGNISSNHYEDFYLMSHCKHNIIANSSFSWWAAWLNNNPEKIVIAPKRWFGNGPQDTQDLIPEGWIKI